MPLGTTLDVSTTVDGFRKVWARRRTDGRLADGTLAFWAHTDWVIVDARGLPTRVPAEFPAVYGELPGPFEPGRVALPPTPAGAAAHRGLVRPQDVDPLGHVNNAAYLDYLEEALLDSRPAATAAVGAIPRTVRIEYLLQAVPGTVVTGSTWRDEPVTGGEARWAWRLTDDDGADLARGTLDGRGARPTTRHRPGNSQERSMTRTVFRGGSVFDGTGSDPQPADVAVEDGRIVDVGSGLDGDDSVDIAGRTLLPGLFDCHVHVTTSHVDLWRIVKHALLLPVLRGGEEPRGDAPGGHDLGARRRRRRPRHPAGASPTG